MKTKTTQFPDPFQYKKSDPNIFAQESTIMHSKKQLEISFWRENKSFEIRKAANSKLKAQSTIELPPANESPRHRSIRNKIKDINRLISMVKSRYSKDSFTSSLLNSTTLRNNSTKEQGESMKSQSKSHKTPKTKKIEINEMDIMLNSYKPLNNPSLDANPLRRRFNTQYERAYRQVISNFFRL